MYMCIYIYCMYVCMQIFDVNLPKIGIWTFGVPKRGSIARVYIENDWMINCDQW